MVALNWATLDATGNPDDSTWLHYIDGNGPGVVSRRRHWWELTNNDFNYRHMMRFPTTLTNARQPAPWFPNGIFLGRDDDGLADDPPKVIFTAAPEPPKAQYNGSNSPITYERGDVVWNSEPLAGGPIGQACITSGTLTLTPFVGVETAEPVNLGDTTVKLNKVDGLESGQYITIDGGTDIYTIVKVTLLDSTIDIAPAALVGAPVGAAIAFSPATFSTFGEVVNIGNSTSYAGNVLLALADRYVTVTMTGMTMTLPPSPEDGQTHSIKSRTGVITMVDTADGVLMDGALSATVGPLENRNFRYSAAINEWEIR